MYNNQQPFSYQRWFVLPPAIVLTKPKLSCSSSLRWIQSLVCEMNEMKFIWLLAVSVRQACSGTGTIDEVSMILCDIVFEVGGSSQLWSQFSRDVAKCNTKVQLTKRRRTQNSFQLSQLFRGWVLKRSRAEVQINGFDLSGIYQHQRLDKSLWTLLWRTTVPTTVVNCPKRVNCARHVSLHVNYVQVLLWLTTS